MVITLKLYLEAKNYIKLVFPHPLGPINKNILFAYLFSIYLADNF